MNRCLALFCWLPAQICNTATYIASVKDVREVSGK